jgi:hypothetical protein
LAGAASKRAGVHDTVTDAGQRDEHDHGDRHPDERTRQGSLSDTLA